ncbi:hypothetical protein TW65_05281 [Stemphylium lycopersici]|nr:hypothetical protein TW65_05281 [Stemphylium lycopersici]
MIVVEDPAALYKRLQAQWAKTEADGDELRDRIELREGLQPCARSWKTIRDAKLGDAFGDGCTFIEQRFIDDPVIPHAKKVFELVEMMKKNTVVDGADLDGVFEVATFLKPGATKEQIAALEKRLSTTFQESEEAVLLGNRLLGDYKDFLRASNRIGEVRPVIERFEKAFADANDTKRRVYERAVLDIYGVIEHLRALQWLVIEFQHSVSEGNRVL